MIGQEYYGQRCALSVGGCNGIVLGFTDDLSMKEFTISGLCQNCQDVVFAEHEDEEDDDFWDELTSF